MRCDRSGRSAARRSLRTHVYIDGERRCHGLAVLRGRLEAPVLHRRDQARHLAGDRLRDVDVVHAAVGADGEEEPRAGRPVDAQRRHRLIQRDRFGMRRGQRRESRAALRREVRDSMGTARSTPPAIVRGSIMPLFVLTSRSAFARCAAAEYSPDGSAVASVRSPFTSTLPALGACARRAGDRRFGLHRAAAIDRHQRHIRSRPSLGLRSRRRMRRRLRRFRLRRIGAMHERADHEGDDDERHECDRAEDAIAHARVARRDVRGSSRRGGAVTAGRATP